MHEHDWRVVYDDSPNLQGFENGTGPAGSTGQTMNRRLGRSNVI